MQNNEEKLKARIAELERHLSIKRAQLKKKNYQIQVLENKVKDLEYKLLP
jgi:polyhydroxyalkanoate synthesis regulator phasin